MLTHNVDYKVKRKDKPWLLFVLALIWVFGTVFFHSPWEPYEPFVFAVVKGIIRNNSWLVPYVSSAPYLEIQPLYFWIYASAIKLLNITNITYIANTVRIINTIIIFAVLTVMGKVGSGVSAFKNGRTTILILISSFGFINTAYKLSPNILIILGFALFLYALQKHRELPGISGWILFIGLLFISINFTCEFIVISISTLVLLPILDKYWRSGRYAITSIIGMLLFFIIFYIYCKQLQEVNGEFFHQWTSRYTRVINREHYNFWTHSFESLKLLSWYTAPGWVLAIWTCYKHSRMLLKDKTLQVCVVLSIILFTFTCISGEYPEDTIFPIVILFALLAAVAVDSIKITIVSFLNSFSIILFGVLGAIIWILYFMLGFDSKNDIIKHLLEVTQNYKFQFNFWQLILALLITIIWLVMITRKHIRGREMVTNWACGLTFAIILFLSLCLPWFDSILTFKPIVDGSLKYINKNYCIATNEYISTQIALWYYYTDISLMPSFINLDYSVCNQAVVATENFNKINLKQWKVLWKAKRPIDNKVYYVVKHL